MMCDYLESRGVLVWAGNTVCIEIRCPSLHLKLEQKRERIKVEQSNTEVVGKYHALLNTKRGFTREERVLF